MKRSSEVTPAWIHMNDQGRVHLTLARRATVCGRVIPELFRTAHDHAWHPSVCKRCLAMCPERGWVRLPGHKLEHHWATRVAGSTPVHVAACGAKNDSYHTIALRALLLDWEWNRPGGLIVRCERCRKRTQAIS